MSCLLRRAQVTITFKGISFYLADLRFTELWIFLRNSYDVLCFNPAKHKFSCGFGSAELSLKSVPIWGKWSIGLWSNHLWRTEMRCWILIYIQEIMWGSQRKRGQMDESIICGITSLIEMHCLSWNKKLVELLWTCWVAVIYCQTPCFLCRNYIIYRNIKCV